MYSLELVITAVLAAAILGAFIGFFISQKTGASLENQRQMENQFKDMQQQQENYQQEVSEHFVETAELLNQLTNSYRDVHNHLAKGAQKLAGDHINTDLELLPDGNSTTKPVELNPENIAPPLDYAPHSPDQTDSSDKGLGSNNIKQKDLEDIAASEDRM